MESLEFVFSLAWKDRSDSGTSFVVLYDTPAVTNSLELFKLKLFKNVGGVDLDAARLKVAMEVNETHEWVIDSQLEFERALLAFRYKASKDEVIVISVHEEGIGSVQNETANDIESMQGSECKGPAQCFFTLVQQFTEKLIEDVSNAGRRSTSIYETFTNTSVSILFPLNTTVSNEEVEEPNDSETELCVPQKKTKPVQNILDLPSKVLLNIFLQLDDVAISKCAQACKKFDELSKDPELFRDIEITGSVSTKYAEWLLSRARDPRKAVFRRNCFYLVANKLGTWHNLEELELWSLDLSDVGEGALKNLRRLSLKFCKINCKTLRRLLQHSKAICKVAFIWIDCSRCGKACDTGILSLLDVETCAEHLEEVHMNNSYGIVQQDLDRLSACTNLKTLYLREVRRTPYRDEAMTAMDVVGRKCTKLERAGFLNLACVTDDVLEVLFANCTNLKELELEGLPNITKKTCLMAIEVLFQLQKIDVKECPLVSRNIKFKSRLAIEILRRLLIRRGPAELVFARRHRKK